MNLVVDLGTSNFRSGIAGKDEIISEPCVVARDQAGGYIVGNQADQMVGRNPDMIEISFPVDGGNVRDLGAAVEVLKYAVNCFFPGRFARRFDLTLSVPSGLTPVEKRALKEAGKLAGARQVELFESAVAAAIGAGLPIENPTGCLIVNLGAGVTEVAVMSMGGIVNASRVNKGGLAVDEAIIDWIRKEYSFVVGKRSAEQLKRRFGEETNSTEIEVRGRNLRTGLPDRLVVPRFMIEDQFAAYYEMIVQQIVQAIEKCPPELVGDIMERGIVLVGGGANVTGILAKLSERIDVPVIIAESPETCVIRGLIQTNWRFNRNQIRAVLPQLLRIKKR